jgi:hypothetical protein
VKEFSMMIKTEDLERAIEELDVHGQINTIDLIIAIDCISSFLVDAKNLRPINSRSEKRRIATQLHKEN